MHNLLRFSLLIACCFVATSLAHPHASENELNFIFSGMIPPNQHRGHPHPPSPCPIPSPSPCPTPSPSPCPTQTPSPPIPCPLPVYPDLYGTEIVVGAALAPFGLNPLDLVRPGFGFEVVSYVCYFFNCTTRFEMVPLSEVLSLIDATTTTGNFNKFTKKINVLADQITVNAARDRFFDYSSVYAQATQYLYVLPNSSFESRDAFVANAANLVGTVVGSVFIATAQTLVGAERVVLFPDFTALTAGLVNGEIQGVLVATVTQLNIDVVALGAPAAVPNNLAMVWPENDAMRNIFNVGLEVLEREGILSSLRLKYKLALKGGPFPL